MREKSVLDGVEVKDKAFPLGDGESPKIRTKTKTLVIIAYCKQCSSPIYGLQSVKSNEDPTVRRTCSCFGFKSQSFGDTICTK